MSSESMLDRQARHLETMVAIERFLSWVHAEHGLQLAEWYANTDVMLPATVDRKRLISDFFGIDVEQLEVEKRALLDELIELNRGEGA